MIGGTTRSRRVLATLQANQGSTTKEMAALTGEPIPYLKRLMEFEASKGVVDSERVGGANRHYVATAFKPAAPDGVALVADIVRNHGPITRADVARRARCGITVALRLLNSLRDSGQVRVVSRGPTLPFLYCNVTTQPSTPESHHAQEAR